MTSPNWSAAVFAWLTSLGFAALIGAAWEWSVLIFMGIAILWAFAWTATKTLYRFLVPKEEAL